MSTPSNRLQARLPASTKEHNFRHHYK